MTASTDKVHMETLNAEEEQQLLEKQRRSNIILGVILLVFALLLAAFTIYSISSSGFVPFDDRDLFRSS